MTRSSDRHRTVTAIHTSAHDSGGGAIRLRAGHACACIVHPNRSTGAPQNHLYCGCLGVSFYLSVCIYTSQRTCRSSLAESTCPLEAASRWYSWYATSDHRPAFTSCTTYCSRPTAWPCVTLPPSALSARAHFSSCGAAAGSLQQRACIDRHNPAQRSHRRHQGMPTHQPFNGENKSKSPH